MTAGTSFGESVTMTDSEEVLEAMCQSYSNAVDTSDSVEYAKLFTEDAVRMPPGGNPEFGLEQIQKGEQAAYDLGKWKLRLTPRNALPIAEGWIYGIADVEASLVAHSDGETSDFRVTMAWLLQRQSTGEWMIKRQMWNLKPD